MMEQARSLSFFLLLPLMLTSAAAQSCTTASCNATSCSPAAILAALPSSSNTNATITVNLPACTSSNTQNSNLVYAIPSAVKELIITGSGTPNSGSATMGPNSSCAATQLIDNAGNSSPMWYFTLGYEQTLRISCFALDPESTTTTLGNLLQVLGTCTSSGCPQVRIDNVTLGLNTYWSESGNGSSAGGGFIVGDVFGVLDHNSVGTPTLSAINMELFNSQNGSYLGTGQYGDNSWAQPDSLGGSNNLFVENNVKYDSGYLAMNDSEQSPGGYPSRGGSRVVMRYNTMYQGSGGKGGYGLFQDHGTDSGGRARGAREAEVYNNKIYCQAPSGTNCSGTDGGLRSGTGLFFGNYWQSTYGGGPWVGLAELRNVTASWQPFAACGGDGPWDQNDQIVYFTGTVGSVSNNSLAMTDPSKSFGNLVPSGSPYSVYDVTQSWWSEISSNTSSTITVYPSVGYGPIDFVAGDSYQVLRATVCLDQPGRGQGSYISGTSTSCSLTSSVIGQLNSLISGPNYTGGPTPCGSASQALDPVYRWNETATSASPNGGIVTDVTQRMIAYRDFYDAASGPQTSSNSPFSCNGSTGGTGWGTLANRPSSCSGACTTNTPGCGYFAVDANSGNGELYVWESGAWTPYYQPYPYPHQLDPNPTVGPGSPTIVTCNGPTSPCNIQ